MMDNGLENSLGKTEHAGAETAKSSRKGPGFSTLVELFEQGYADYANDLAVSNMGRSLSYSKLAELSRDFASYLQNEFKIKKGDRVAIMMPNCLQYYVALHGILRAGGVVVNINPLYTSRELALQLNDAQCENIILSSTCGARLAEIQSSTPIKNIIVTHLGDLLGLIKGTLLNAIVKYVKHLVPSFDIPQAVFFKQVLAQGRLANFTRVECLSSDMAFLQYTGGTTGVSKGAIISHGNMCANVHQARAWAGERLDEYAHVALTPLPLYHIFSLMINAFAVYSVGGHVVLVTNPRDIPGLLKTWQKYPVTMLTGINTLYAAILNNPAFSKMDFSQLKLSISGGMGTHESVANEWQRITKKCIIEGYGLTEASPVITINPINISRFNGSIGKPLVDTVIEVRDDQGQALPVGEVGELCAKGPQVMVGYWHNPQETALVLSEDGWLKTGDMCSINEQGYVNLIDRKKELIVVSGFKVYPNEVEAVLTSHPGVLEAAAIGASDEKSGEHVKAFVVKKDPALTAEELIDYCRKNLTGYKRPHEVVFRDELPKSNVGKILRRVLRDEEEAQS